MTNKTVYTVELNDNGTIKAKTADIKQFNGEMAKSAGVSKAVKASYQSYDQARASGGTGAAGRDFAKQSEGLGGLVRVYATFAANIFAVSAAFNALSSAADTANLVKGLDQLGAATGRNLGTLSKRLVEATDNSVSLREAMTATAQASAAGMSSTEILKMAKGAKQASQALGIDMSDALSRLSRGITKLEPELLDELGIFIRVDKAAQDYAISIGKPVSALTTFEKQASFTKAALDQLEKKFGGIDIDANPYTQLLASLKNVTSAGLDLINTFLGPVVRLLATSPTALILGLGLIATTLLRQAVPALGAWRSELKAAAETANATVAKNKELYDSYKSDILQKDTSKQAAAFRQATTAANTHKDSLTKLADINKRSSLSKSITQFTETPTAENAAIVNAKAEARAKHLNAEAIKGVTAARAIDIDTELKGIARVKPQVQALIETNKELNKTSKEYKGAGSGYFSMGAIYERLDVSAKKAAKSAQIVSNAVENTAFGPLVAASFALKEINKAVSAGEMSKVGAFFTSFKVGAAIAVVGINTLLASMGGILNIIGVVIGFTTLLVSIFSDTAKEATNFSSAIDTLKASFDNVDRTLELISKKDPLERMGIASTQAIANAYIELSDNVDSAAKAFDKLKSKSTNFIDSSLDWIKSFANMDMTSVLADQISVAMDKAILLLDDPAKKEELRSKFLDALGVTDLGKTSVREKIKSLPDFEVESSVGKVKSTIGASAREVASAAFELTAYKNTVDEAVKSNQELLNTFNLTDPLAKLGIGLLATSSSLDKIKDSSTQSQKAILDLMGDTKKMALFGEDFALGLLKIKNAYSDNSAEVKKYTDKLEEEKQKLLELKRVQQEGTKGWAALTSSRADIESRAFAVTDQEQTVKLAEQRAERAKTKLVKLDIDAQALATKGMQIAFVEGSKLIEQSLKNGAANAAITVAKAGLGVLTGSARLSAENKLADASLKLQYQELDISKNQILIQTKLNNTLEETNALYRQEIAKRDKGVESPEYKQASKDVAATQAISAKLGSGKNTIPGIQQAVEAGKSAPADSLEADIGRRLSGASIALKGIGAKKQGLDADKRARDIENIPKQVMNTLEEETLPNIQQQKTLNSLAIERSDVYKGMLSTQSEAMIKARTELELTNLVLTAAEGSETTKAKVLAVEKLIAETSNGLLEPEQKKQKILEAQKQSREDILGKEKVEIVLAKSSVDIQKSKEASLARELTLRDAIKATAMATKTGEQDVKDALTARAFASGKITEDKKNSLDYESSFNRLNLDTGKQRIDNEQLLTTAKDKANKMTLESFGNDKAKLDEAQANSKNEISLLTEQGKLIEANADSKYKVLEISKKLSAQEQGIQDILLKGVDSMSDALTDFAITGEKSFGKMIDSMLADLLRLEIRLMMRNAYADAGGGSVLGSLLSKFLGGGKESIGIDTSVADKGRKFASDMSGGGDFGSGADFGNQDLAAYLAKGGAFDSGVQKFAKGGAFTNSVVNSPTMFKFAKGAGLMGEAGPEAIMPLKRDAQGNLGIRGGAGGSNTSVVVNNYTQATATTKESVDSRGQRKIEVIIGEAVAGELAKAGSAVQQSFNSNYGARPVIARR